MNSELIEKISSPKGMRFKLYSSDFYNYKVLIIVSIEWTRLKEILESVWKTRINTVRKQMNFLFSRFLKFFLYCSTVLDGAFLEKIYQIINPLEAMSGKFYQLSIFRKPYLNSNKILLHKKFVFSAEDDNRPILHIVPHPRHSQWALAKKSSFVWEVKILQKVI